MQITRIFDPQKPAVNLLPVNRRKEKRWEGIDVCVLAGATFPLSRQVSALEQLRSFGPCTDLLQIMLMLSGEQLKWAFTDTAFTDTLPGYEVLFGL